MKRWKKEILRAFGIGIAAIAIIFGLAELSGAKFGPCGPGNDAGAFLFCAMLPAMLSLAWLPSGEAWAWLTSLLFWPALLLTYSLPAWIVVRALRHKSASKLCAGQQIAPRGPSPGSDN